MLRLLTIFVSILFGTIFFCEYSHAQNLKKENFDFQFETGIGVYDAPELSYLGTQIGAGPNNFDFLTSNKNIITNYQNFSVSYLFQNLDALRFNTSVETSQGYRKDTIGNINTDNNLLIPGVGVGPDAAGFALGGPNADITNARLQSKYKYTAFDLSVSKPIRSYKKFNFEPNIGLLYKKTKTQNGFKGDIINGFFDADFNYQTNISVETINPYIGIKNSYLISPNLSLLSNIRFFYDLNNGKGYDQLSFRNVATISQQEIKIKNNDQTQSYTVNLGFKYDVTPKLSFGVNTEYQRIGNAPDLNTRDGVGVSDFSYKSVSYYKAGITASYKF